MITENLMVLRKIMKNRHIDIYIVPTADFHSSEYISDYFKVREYLTGFTGSAGTFLLLEDDAVLFTDGRYFIQAEKELEGSGIRLMRMGEPGVPLFTEYIAENLPYNGVVAVDGKMISAQAGMAIKAAIKPLFGRLENHPDLIDFVWDNRPPMEFSNVFYLQERFAGESVKSKLQRVREEMKRQDADVHIITSLDDIAWLFNIRGSDILYNPVIFAFAMITHEQAIIFSATDMPEELSEAGVTNLPYREAYTYIKNIKMKSKVLLDKSKVNFQMYSMIGVGVQILDAPNPESLFKAIKNETELENLRKCHIKDGVAVTKFMYWLKNNVGKETITEISAAQYLENLRYEMDYYVEPSFATISAYKEHAAMMHYEATGQSNYTLEPEGMLLVDSGGQYLEGTTDITRTFVLGPISDEMKLHFTTVTKSMLRLSDAKFMHGCTGQNLDVLAREPLWKLGLDYKCGTGHGVGFLLNVHEGPNGFRWKSVPERMDSAVFEKGMVTTNEPGVYIENSHGIRIENELVCIENADTRWGRFMGFETITFAPIDLDGIDPKYLNSHDKECLNSYHQAVYDKISPYLTNEERVWLKQYTRSI
ncbi:MAG: aminopeptidase P family protein [Eubacterium sp.]